MARSLQKWKLPENVNPATSRCYLVTVPDDPAYIRAFKGIMFELAKPYRWANDEAHTAVDVGQIWADLYDKLHEIGCDALMPDPNTPCLAYPLNSPWVTFSPADPYTDPSLVPEGYLLPPFTVVKPGDIYNLEGWTPGDLVTDITRFPIGSLPTVVPPGGYARLRLYVTGTGIVQIEFVPVLLGGVALVSIDDNPLVVGTVELNQDVTSAPPESEDTIIQEYTFETPGAHHIDITFLPWVNDEVPFIYYGGGIRKLELCGFEEMAMQARACESGCGIEISIDNGQTWQCIDLSDCIADIVATGIIDGINSGLLAGGTSQTVPQPRPAPTVCNTYHVFLEGNEIWHCPQPIASGDTVLVANAVGAWWDGYPLVWYCPDGNFFYAGMCVSGSRWHDFGDRNEAAYHMAIVGHYDNDWFDPFITYTVPGGVALTDLFLQANDSPLADNRGRIEFDVTVCASNSWAHRFALYTTLGYKWIPLTGRGSWASDQWNEVYYQGGYVLYVYLDLPVLTNGVYGSILVTQSQGLAAGDNIRLWSLPGVQGTVLKENDDSAGYMEFPEDYAGGGSLLLSPGDAGKHPFYIRELTIYGTGSDPF